MTLEQIQEKIINKIGRETIDKFIEDNRGNLAGFETLSVAEIVKEIYELTKSDYAEQNERLKYKLGLITSDNQDLNKKVSDLEKELSDKESRWAKWCEQQLKDQAKKICEEIKAIDMIEIFRHDLIGYCIWNKKNNDDTYNIFRNLQIKIDNTAKRAEVLVNNQIDQIQSKYEEVANEKR